MKQLRRFVFVWLCCALALHGCNCSGGGSVEDVPEPTGVGPGAETFNAYECICTCGIRAFPDAEQATVSACLPEPIEFGPDGEIDVEALRQDCQQRVCGDGAQAIGQLERGRQAGQCIQCTGELATQTDGTPIVHNVPVCNNCEPVACEPGNNVCNERTLEGDDAGTVTADGEKCCNFVSENADRDGCGEAVGPSGRSATVCVAPSADPPVIPEIGLHARQSSQMSSGEVNPIESKLVLVPNGDESKRVSLPISGRVNLTNGVDDGKFGISLRLNIQGDAKLSVSVPTGVFPVPADVETENVTLLGATTPDAVVLSSNSVTTTISEDDFFFWIRGRRHIDLLGQIPVPFLADFEGEKEDAFFGLSDQPLDFSYDKSTGEFLVRALFSVPRDPGDFQPEVQAELLLRGLILQSPPKADAGPAARVVECDSPDGAEVTLDATASSDPDGDITFYSWHRGTSTFSPLVGSGAQVTTQQGFGEQEYTVAVSDGSAQVSSASTSVEVVDSTPPDVGGIINEGPPCLWAPNHKYVVLRLNRDIKAMVEDACDLDPEITISGASSSQPDNAEGDGDTVNDALAYPDRVCLRAERQGQESRGRYYTIELTARDDFGNESKPTIRIWAPHDQAQPGASDCRYLRDVETVEDDSSVCDPSAASVLRNDNLEVALDEGVQTDSGPARASNSHGAGCSVVEDESHVPLNLVSLVLLMLFGGWRFTQRRRSK